MKTLTETKTIYTFESICHVWYIDYTEGDRLPYQVCRDEISKVSRKTLGEAIEYILSQTPITEWVMKK